jgi:hypothetical protein
LWGINNAVYQTFFQYIEAVFLFEGKSHGGEFDHGYFFVGVFDGGDGVGGFDERIKWV